MTTELTEIFKSFNVLLGALCALLGAFVQKRFEEKYRKNAFLAQKLERAYLLCQEIYDGHNREINNALKTLPQNAKEFLDKRNHPGKETSELKMLIRSYAPDTANDLIDIDKGHDPLKKQFIELEKKLLSGNSITQTELDQYNVVWQEKLKLLGDGSLSLKRKIEKKLNKLVK